MHVLSELYERGSGAKLNLSKCEGLWLGAWNGRSDSPVPITWSPVKIKVLGVFLGPGNLEEANWQPRIEAVEHVLNSQRQRSLSFKGKALVFNALGLALIWYVASLIHVPEWIVFEINKLIFQFFWSGKHDLVPRKVVIQPKGNGGFGMVDVRFKISALHVQWVRWYVTSPSSWSFFLSYCFLHCFGATPLRFFQPCLFSRLIVCLLSILLFLMHGVPVVVTSPHLLWEWDLALLFSLF